MKNILLVCYSTRGRREAAVITPTSYIQRNLAVIKTGEYLERYGITHIPTGLRVGEAQDFRQAQAIVRAMNQKALYEDGDGAIHDLFDEFTDGVSSPLTPRLQEEWLKVRERAYYAYIEQAHAREAAKGAGK